MKINNINKTPEHIGIIMDGNRRWAKAHNLPTYMGHQQGSKALESILEYANEAGVKTVTVYAFSSENFVKRTKQEVKDLMRLLRYFMIKKRQKLNRLGAKLCILGELKAFPETLQRAIKTTVGLLASNNKVKINIALNYGGRPEIVQAVKQIIEDKVKAEDVNEELISKYLYTKEDKDPDLIIRTGGELRLSNFLTWQASYSELYFTETLWPDFSPKHLEKAISEYNARQRRYGK